MLIYERSIADEYFVCELKVQLLTDKYHLGKIRIYRKDTSETVLGENCFNLSLTQVITSLEKIAGDFFEKSKKPASWKNLAPEKRVVFSFLEYQESINRYFHKEQDSYDADSHFHILTELHEKTKHGVLHISAQVMKLTKAQKERLVHGSREEYGNMEDPRVLEILRAKTELFKYILNPSESLLKLHENHCKKMGCES